MKVYLGFGANKGAREKNIRRAINALDGVIGRLEACSSLYETRPVGFKSSNLFFNAVAIYEGTTLSPSEVLKSIQDLEAKLGRRTKSVNGIYKDRVIDIDILLMDDIVLNTSTLQLPHPEMTKRRFVLAPLCELAPTLRHPLTGLTIEEHLKQLNRFTIKEILRPSLRIEVLVNTLMTQLSPQSSKEMRQGYLKTMLSKRTTHFYVGYDETDCPCAMASLCLTFSPTGIKAWVEDLVVEEDSRGRGYGHAFIEFLKTESVRLGAKSLNLTSQPKREEANKLYVSAGMKPRHTNVYRWTSEDA